MEFVTQLATIAVVMLLACISPGPDFVAVTSHSLASRRSGLRIAFGICTAVTVWSAVTICGLALVLAKVAWLYEIIRLAGAAYLIYLGIQLLLASRRQAPEAHSPSPRAIDGSFARGFLIGITNPKTAAFFSSLFATILPASAPVWVYAAIVAIAGIVSVGWFSSLALMFSAGKVQHLYRRAHRWIDAAMGTVLTLIGVRLAVTATS